MDTYLDRIQKFIDHKGLSNRKFEAKISISNGLIGKNIKSGGNLGGDILEKILREFPELSADWLLLGEGAMIRGVENNLTKLKDLEKITHERDILKDKLLIQHERYQALLEKYNLLEEELRNKKQA